MCPVLSRRSAIKSLATALAGSSLGSYPWGEARALCSIGPRIRTIDASYDVRSILPTLIKAGVRSIGRYYSRHDSGCYASTKRLTLAELDAIEKNPNMSVFVVFQYCNRCVGLLDLSHRDPDTIDLAVARQLGLQRGKIDANEAVLMAQEMKQPEETPIYFGMDFNPAYSDSGDQKCPVKDEIIDHFSLAYFEAIGPIVRKSHRKVGVYGAGHTCQLVRDNDGLAEFFWLSASISFKGHQDFFNKEKWHIFQTSTEIPLNNFFSGAGSEETIDTNVLNPDVTDVGQWRRDKKLIEVDEEEANAILRGRGFLTDPCVYADQSCKEKIPNIHGIRPRYGHIYRILKCTKDIVEINASEGDTRDGYSRVADLTVGLKGAMPDYNARNDGPGVYACVQR